MRGDAIGAGLLVAAGLYAGFAAYGFGLGKLSEPGPGFFPFVASVLIVLCSSIIVFGALVSPLRKRFVMGERAPPTRWVRIWLCVAALAAYAVALPWLGFGISTFLLMVGVSRIDPTVTWRMAFVIGSAGAVAFWVVFAYLLKVNFPPPTIGF